MRNISILLLFTLLFCPVCVGKDLPTDTDYFIRDIGLNDTVLGRACAKNLTEMEQKKSIATLGSIKKSIKDTDKKLKQLEREYSADKNELLTTI